MRAIIKSAMKRREVSAYKLAKLLAPNITEPTIVNFIKGTTELTSGRLALLLNALDLQIVAKSRGLTQRASSRARRVKTQ